MKTAYPKYDKENMARVLSTDLPISVRHSIELCRYIKGRNTKKVIALLQKILDHEIALPLIKYNAKIPHKPGMSAGAYPKNATTCFIGLIKSVEANAQDKGLNTDSLRIIHASANRGPKVYHSGRHTGRTRKITHVEIVVKEEEKSKEKKVNKK